MGVIFILSTIDLMGLNVVVAVTEAGMCHLLLFAVDILSEKDTEGERESFHFIFVSQCQCDLVLPFVRKYPDFSHRRVFW